MRADEQRFRSQLEALSPGLREKIRDERKAQLSPEELAAFSTTKNAQEMIPDELAAYTRAFHKLTVTDMDLAEAMPPEVRPKARYYAMRSSESNVLSDRIASYAMIVNYEYWRTRCEVEQSKITADARRYMMMADQAAERGDPEGAREQYELAWDEWVQIFEDYPQLVNDVMAEDLQEVIFRYKLVLDQLDIPFPKDFKLQILVPERMSGPPDGKPPASRPPGDPEGRAPKSEPAAEKAKEADKVGGE